VGQRECGTPARGVNKKNEKRRALESVEAVETGPLSRSGVGGKKKDANRP